MITHKKLCAKCVRIPQRKQVGPVNILLIEDCQADADTIMRHIGVMEHGCHCVSSLSELQKISVKDYDFAVVDLWIAGSDPQQTIATMEKAGIPYVITTGSNDPVVAREIGEHEIGYTIKHAEDMEAIAQYAVGRAQAAKRKAEEDEEFWQVVEDAKKIFKDE
jgi:hypothetical protein